MGRGDKRTRRGKIFKGSYGNVRLQETAPKSVAVKKTATSSETGAGKKAPATKKSK